MFLLLFLTVFLAFSPARAQVLPPTAAGEDFVRLFETGLAPYDDDWFYYTGFGEGPYCEQNAYQEAVKKLTDRITGMQDIVNTPEFTPFLFNDHKTEPAYGQPRYWGIYRNKKINIQKQRDRIVSLKILAKEAKEKPEDPDRYIKDADVFYVSGGKDVFVGKTPVIDLPVFIPKPSKKEKFRLKKRGYYDTAATECRIVKKKNSCTFVMDRIPEPDANGCAVFIGLLLFFLFFTKSGQRLLRRIK